MTGPRGVRRGSRRVKGQRDSNVDSGRVLVAEEGVEQGLPTRGPLQFSRGKASTKTRQIAKGVTKCFSIFPEKRSYPPIPPSTWRIFARDTIQYADE